MKYHMVHSHNEKNYKPVKKKKISAAVYALIGKDLEGYTGKAVKVITM